jgi:hypothetical protein
LEERNYILELLRDVVREGQKILNLIIQAPHEGSAFCRVIALNISGIALKFCIIGGEVVLCLFEHLQFLFCCRHKIWISENHFPHHDQLGDICQLDALITDVGLDLHEGLAY